MHLVYPPRFLRNYCYQFYLGIIVVSTVIEVNGYVIFWGVDKVLYGLCENCELVFM